jgi:hypothetical protein
MSDRLIGEAWRLSVLGMILAVSLAGMAATYRGMIHLLAMHWPPAAVLFAAACLCGAGAYWLARHRNDLADLC